ncbi:PepSY domain-containing protein [Piscinibacter sakaiensis]|uniref:PepSY domain-containing protein n=1 Tax=Piscinibacter sakaiensis TaxID=1547922 RepID=A0A0K8NUF7_PISS1|nr:PepSY domain-containing protein [Piscinibacter sakaiensis]GAP33904.1 hypothetical protein ISF6_1682 [Piscinibacter sakaiensis]
MPRAPFPSSSPWPATAARGQRRSGRAAAAGLAALGIAAAVALAGPSAAQAPVPAPATAPAAAPSPAAGMDFAQLLQRLSAQGYHDVTEIERKGDKLVEVTLRERDGTRVELLLDARSGEVLRREAKRDKRHH